MKRLFLMSLLALLCLFGYGQGVKNINGKLYAYSIRGASPVCKTVFGQMEAGVDFFLSFKIDDSTGTNRYILKLTSQLGNKLLLMDTVERGTHHFTFRLTAGPSDVTFYLSSYNPTARPAHNFYLDDIQVAYEGWITTEEPADDYRFGFNGHEKDNEMRGDDNTYSFGDYGYDPRLVRRANIDPQAQRYPGQSPYSVLNNAPILYNDPTGHSGEVTIDRQAHTLTITSHFVLYGNAASAALASSTAKDIQDKWNEPQGKVMIDGQVYKVKFVITAEYKPGLTPAEVSRNTDIRNNYIRVEENTNFPGRGSYMTKTSTADPSSNSGYWKLSEIIADQSSTEAHEVGHGYGLDHPNTDQRGIGQPGIMCPRGTAVDAPYTYEPAKGDTQIYPDETRSNTMQPQTRKVTQDDINKLGLDKLKFNSKNKAPLGKLTNIFFK